MQKYVFSIGSEVCDAFLGPDALSALSSYLQTNADKYSKIFLLTDDNIRNSCLPFLLKNVSFPKVPEIISIAPGEINKSIDTAICIWKTLQSRGADRHSLIVNLGGGVICDLGGFVASSFKRGMPFINLPTTLLAMVDAAIGGKVGVDLEGNKNQVGFFALPGAVFLITDFLKTLPERQIKAGFAEMLKHALIADEKYWKQLTANIFSVKYNWNQMIVDSIRIKSGIVNGDPKEKGPRKLLNFGHTIGHALESYSLLYDKDPLLHGEAIAAGMLCEAWLSVKKAGLPRQSLEEIVDKISGIFPKYPLQQDVLDSVVTNIAFDKKNFGAETRFTLLTGIGCAATDFTCDKKLIRKSLSFYIQH